MGKILDSQADPLLFTQTSFCFLTRALWGEGGPAAFPRTNREILTTLAPGAFARVDAKWADLIARAGKA